MSPTSTSDFIDMPYGAEDTSGLRLDLGYKYPKGLDLRPSSKLHEKLLNRLNERALSAYELTRRRFPQWRQLDETLNAFIPLDSFEQLQKQNDRRSPVSVVIPVSFALLDTMLTFSVETFIRDPFFRLSGMGPEDELGAMLLEKVLQQQMRWFNNGMGLHTAFRSGYAYGTGPVHVRWSSMPTRPSKSRGTLGSNGQFGLTRPSKGFIEGNDFEAIDPYRYLPDPTQPAHEIDKMEFVGWFGDDNRFNLLDRESREKGWFNAKYLKFITGRSQLSLGGTSGGFDAELERAVTGRRDGFANERSGLNSQAVTGYSMYVRLIPSEWGLPGGNTPKTWVFSVAGDQVILRANQVDFDHGMFPIAVNVPDTDGFTGTPTSRLEQFFPLQGHVNWLINAHFANVKAAVNNRVVFDPSRVSVKALKNAQAGGLIPTKRSWYGKSVADALFQMPVNDVTRGHIPDALQIISQMQNFSGATDIVQGFQQRGGERVTAREISERKIGSLSRLQRMAKLTSMTLMQRVGRLSAFHTQQFLDDALYVSILGRNQEELRKSFGLGDNDTRVLADPQSLDVSFDLEIFDGTMNGGQYLQDWLQLYQIMTANPELAQNYNLFAVFATIARLMQVDNIEQYRNQAPPQINPQVLPDEQVLAQQQAGNVVPIGEAFSQ